MVGQVEDMERQWARPLGRRSVKWHRGTDGMFDTAIGDTVDLAIYIRSVPDLHSTQISRGV